MEDVRNKTERGTQASRESGKVIEKETSLGIINPPESIQPRHDLSSFCSGEQSLDDWLVKRALKNQQNNYSNVFVITTDNHKVIGYYALSSYAIARENIVDMRSAPDPVPAVLLGRLAVDKNYQGHGLGEGLLRDALNRIISAKQDIAIKVIVVHALNERVVGYYQQLGFEKLSSDSLTLYITVSDLEETYKTL